MPIIDAMRPDLKTRSTSAAVHDIDLLERRAHGFFALHRRRHVDRPELSADSALAQPRDVGMQLRHAAGDVGGREVTPGTHAAERPRIIVVPVDERHLLVQRTGAGGDVALGR
jgi:hypothetical protein